MNKKQKTLTVVALLVFIAIGLIEVGIGVVDAGPQWRQCELSSRGLAFLVPMFFSGQSMANT
jgi:hypothetical protein